MALSRLLRCAAAAALCVGLAAGAAAAANARDAVLLDEACTSSSSAECNVLSLLQHASMDVQARRQPITSIGGGDDVAASTTTDTTTTTTTQSMEACKRSFRGELKVEAVPMPKLSDKMALVKVEASSVNPLDWKVGIPGVAGRDFAGSVVAVSGECGVQAGDSVWGDAPSGAWAQYLAVRCDLVGLRPSQATAEQAGATPHAGLTAQQALTSGDFPWSKSPTVVVLGGSGGVGHVAIQLAKAYGAGKVVTTCSPSNFAFVTSLGADQTIDYHTANWWEVLGEDSVDFVLDTVGLAGTGANASAVLRRGGRFVSLLGGKAMAWEPKNGTSQEWVRLSHTSTQYLDSLKALVDSGNLQVHIGASFALGQVADAVSDSKAGHSIGKISITMA